MKQPRSTWVHGAATTAVLVLLVLMSSFSFAQQPTTTPTPTFRETIRFTTATARPPTATPSITPTPTTSPTPSQTPTPTVTSVYDTLRENVTDADLAVRFLLDETCFVTGNEITGRIVLRNLKDEAVYIYLSGQIAFSINNSPLLPSFPPPVPSDRTEFILLQPNAEVVIFELEDLGLFVQGMGPESGIDFSESGIIFGLPIGEYWVTAAYSNPHDGLDEQFDGTYLVPEAAWRGLTISRERRFTVVADAAECP